MRRNRKLLVLCALLLLCCYAVARPTTSADPLSCGPDVNLDGVVDVFDLVRVAAKYGMEVPGGLPPWAKEDTNGDGKICIADLVCVSSNYGRGVTATPTATPSATPTSTPPTPTPTPTGTPSPTPAAVCPPAMPSGLTRAVVIKVVDGDTIWVRIGSQEPQKVRYIGADTPETVHPRMPVEPFGPEASAKNAELVAGGVVYLERDVQDRETDQYEDPRLLRYIWVGDLMVNAELVRLGYAQASTYPPNVKYEDCLVQLQREARQNRKGLWALEPTSGAISVVAWVSDETPSQYSTVTVYGKITRGGAGIPGVPMIATWHYKTGPSYCEDTISGTSGIALCSRRIGRATKGRRVQIDVQFTYQGRSYWSSTEFTPH